MFSRRSNKALVRWDLTVILFTLSLAMAAPGVALSASKSIKGSWGCYGQGVFGKSPTTLAIPFPAFSFGDTIQLTADSKGNVTSGTILYGLAEICHFSVASGSTYSIDPTGLGDLNLKLTINPHDDNDVHCSVRFGNPPANDFKTLLTSHGKQFFFTHSDDFLTSATELTGGDFFPISGQCIKQ